MAKIQRIEKARKERKCGKCGTLIAKGTPYLKGVINFHPDIVRCIKCGLQQWEVTTSEYQLEVGAIAYNWRDDYSVDETTAEELQSALESIRDNEQDKLYNLPEQLQSSPNGELLQERIDALDTTIDELSSIDIDDLKREVMDECPDLDEEDDVQYDDIINMEEYADIKETLEAELISKIEEAIDAALENLCI